MLKELFHFWLRSLPLVLGLVSTLIAFAYLIIFTDRTRDENLLTFVVFALIGLPLTLFGINRLADK